MDEWWVRPVDSNTKVPRLLQRRALLVHALPNFHPCSSSFWPQNKVQTASINALGSPGLSPALWGLNARQGTGARLFPEGSPGRCLSKISIGHFLSTQGQKNLRSHLCVTPTVILKDAVLHTRWNQVASRVSKKPTLFLFPYSVSFFIFISLYNLNNILPSLLLFT